jgi:DUF4097 and DUF4098 domain-containing protein YvlB
VDTFPKRQKTCHKPGIDGVLLIVRTISLEVKGAAIMSWLYTVLFAGLVLSSQDSVAVRDLNVVDVSSTVESLVQGETEKFQQVYPLNANGRVRVSNVNGSITVEAWDRNEVQLTYTKIADTKERLSEVEVRIESRPEFFSVESDYDNWKIRNKDEWRDNGRLRVEYRLMVPRGAVLNEIETVNGSVAVSNFTNVTRVSAVNGSVKAVNIRGTARLSTVNGEVFADFDKLESGSRISLDTVNGKVNLFIPSDSNATLKADSVNGSIINDFGLPVSKGKYVGRDLYGRLGNGDVDIRLNSVNGILSISRKNDGRSPSPATNLLPQKNVDDEEWNKLNVDLSTNTATINKEVDKAVKESLKIAQKELAKTQVKLKDMGPDIARITANSVKLASDNFKMEELAERIAESQRAQSTLARLGDFSFFPGVPRVEKKSDSFPVKGMPKITVDAKGCSVSVRGWDKNEVQYRVTQFSPARDQNPFKIDENHTETAFNLTVVNDTPATGGGRLFSAQKQVRIEIYVPKKSNLKIDASGEIRIEGVSGDVELSGDDESINVRDGDGKLRVNTSDGRVRVIGFTGDLEVQSSDGALNLEGDFRTLNARAREGSVMLTLPEKVSADLDVTGSEVKGEGLNVTKTGGDETRSKYRVRDGGRLYKIATSGEIVVRTTEAIASVY